MDPMTVALLASAALGLYKGQEQQKAYKQAQKVESTRERWAPFTGKRGQTVTQPSRIDPLMQSLMAGAMIGQQFQGGAAPTDAQANAAAGNAGGSAELGSMPLPAPSGANRNARFGDEGYLDPYRNGFQTYTAPSPAYNGPTR